MVGVLTQKVYSFFKKYFIYLFLERGEGREKKRERKHQCVVASLTPPQLGILPTTQASHLTGNLTGDPLVYRPALNPLNHTS